jgi:hypothetical protein
MRYLLTAALTAITCSVEVQAQGAWQLRTYLVATNVGCMNKPNLKAFHEWLPDGSNGQRAALDEALDREFPKAGKEWAYLSVTAIADDRQLPIVGLVKHKLRCRDYNLNVVGQFTHYKYYTGRSREAIGSAIANALSADENLSGDQVEYLEVRQEIDQAKKETASGKRFAGFSVRK